MRLQRPLGEKMKLSGCCQTRSKLIGRRYKLGGCGWGFGCAVAAVPWRQRPDGCHHSDASAQRACEAQLISVGKQAGTQNMCACLTLSLYLQGTHGQACIWTQLSHPLLRRNRSSVSPRSLFPHGGGLRDSGKEATRRLDTCIQQICLTRGRDRTRQTVSLRLPP